VRNLARGRAGRQILRKHGIEVLDAVPIEEIRATAPVHEPQLPAIERAMILSHDWLDGCQIRPALRKYLRLRWSRRDRLARRARFQHPIPTKGSMTSDAERDADPRRTKARKCRPQGCPLRFSRSDVVAIGHAD